MTNSKVKTTAPKIKKEMSTNTVRTLESLKAVGYAFLVGIILVILTGQGSSILNFIKGFFDFNFGTMSDFTSYLARLTYLVPLGLALAVSFRMGIFNIGAAGQSLGGGTAAYIVASTISAGKLGWIFTIIFGVLVGMGIALLIALLKNRFNINEVISSIMLNWIIFYFVKYISFDENSIKMYNDLRMDWIYSIFGAGMGVSNSLNFGLILIIPLVITLWYAYTKTKWGYKQEVVGNNSNVGKYLGINYKREVYKTMAISGALAGLAGTIYLTGVNTSLPGTEIKDIPGWTFDGITIALLGFNSPIGVMMSSLLYGLFDSDIDNIVGNLGIENVMIAIMIIFIARSNYRIQYGKRGTFVKLKEKYRTSDLRSDESTKGLDENIMYFNSMKKGGGK